MKRLITIVFVLLFSLNSFAQSDDPETSAYWSVRDKNKNYGETVSKESSETTNQPFYQKEEEYLIYSKVIDFPSKSKIEIINGFKNWGSTSFVNLKEVIVSETEDQIVLNYISQSMSFKTLGTSTSVSWYLRLIAEFKDGKMRVSFYDDGNAFWPGNQYAPSTSARTYKLTMYFKDGKPRKGAYDGLLNLKRSIEATANSIKLVEHKKNNDNW